MSKAYATPLQSSATRPSKSCIKSSRPNWGSVQSTALTEVYELGCTMELPSMCAFDLPMHVYVCVLRLSIKALHFGVVGGWKGLWIFFFPFIPIFLTGGIIFFLIRRCNHWIASSFIFSFWPKYHSTLTLKQHHKRNHWSQPGAGDIRHRSYRQL